jgi:hypothetical protein
MPVRENRITPTQCHVISPVVLLFCCSVVLLFCCSAAVYSGAVPAVVGEPSSNCER